MNVLLICKKRSRLFFHFLVHVSLEIYLKMTTENIYEKKNVLIYLCTCSERKHVFEIHVHVRNNCQGFLRRRTNGPAGGACAPRTPLSAPNEVRQLCRTVRLSSLTTRCRASQGELRWERRTLDYLDRDDREGRRTCRGIFLLCKNKYVLV